MPLTRNSNEQKIADILFSIEQYLADKEDIVYSTTSEGFLFQSPNGHNRCVLAREKTVHGCWRLECDNVTEDWTRTVLAILPDNDAIHVLPEMIRRWCHGTGALFNVRPNGNIPAYQACRTNGKNHRLPLGVDYNEYTTIKTDRPKEN